LLGRDSSYKKFGVGIYIQKEFRHLKKNGACSKKLSRKKKLKGKLFSVLV